MSTSMMRPSQMRAFSTSWSAFISRSGVSTAAVSPVAGPSRLRWTAQSCSCGEPLLPGAATPGTGGLQVSNSRRRWMSSKRTLHQSAGVSTSSPASQAPPSLSTSTTRFGLDKNIPPSAVTEASASSSSTTDTPVVGPKPPAPRSRPARREIKAQKAAITLTPTAVEQLSALLDSPTPKLIRIGVRNKGCAGMAYHLEYVEKPGKFDEVIKQDGVTVLIDSKALFSIVGSEMDWQEDKISSKFVFKNPNIKEQCGCGESFLT